MCDGFECVELVPGAFEHRTWAPGEPVEWPEGAFALQTATGRVEGYRLTPEHANAAWPHAADWLHAVDYRLYPSAWVAARITTAEPRSEIPAGYAWRAYVLLNRETLRAWRWRADELELEAVSDDHVLLRDTTDGIYTLMTSDGDVRTQFSLPGADDERASLNSFFSPDGQTLVVNVNWPRPGRVYRMHVADPQPEVFFEARPGRYGHTSAWAESSSMPHGTGWEPFWRVRYAGPGAIFVSENHDEAHHYFDWDGNPVSLPSRDCVGDASPDGRYVAQHEGFALGHKWHGHTPPDTGPWPLVVILDAESCEPIVRVLSAYWYQGYWEAAWLPNSTGYVVGLAGTHAVLQVHPEPGLTYLPPGPYSSGPIPVARLPGPVPAPSGDGRYFSYEFVGVYDAQEGDWKGVDFASVDVTRGWPKSEASWDFTRWGATHEEIHYQTGEWSPFWQWDGWFGAHVVWYLLQPKVELPPFDELTFVVARTRSCLGIYDAPDGGAVLGCLPDGTRLSWTRPSGRAEHPYSHLGAGHLHVRTADGIEGWVSLDFLDHY